MLIKLKKNKNIIKMIILFSLSPFIFTIYAVILYNIFGPNKVDSSSFLEISYLLISFFLTIISCYLVYKKGIFSKRKKGSELAEVENEAYFISKTQSTESLLQEKDYKENIKDDILINENKDENIKERLIEHNISQQRFDKAIGFLDRSIFKETLNPTSKEDLFTIESDEFRLLNNLGLVHQQAKYPYLITISKNEFDIRMAKNFNFYEEDRKIKIPLSNNFDNLENGFQFEVQIAKLLIDLNYTNVEVLAASGDYGADILAEKNMVSFAIQCKYYSTPVGLAAVQEISSGKKHYNAQVGVVITNSTFTKPAFNLAKTNNIVLWDGEQLQKMIDKVNFRIF